MLQNNQTRRNIRSFRRWLCSGGRNKPEMAAMAANLLTVRLSSGISANILDFRLPQKHVLRAVPAAGRPQGRPQAWDQTPTNSAAAQARNQRQSGREPMAVSIEQARRDRPAPEIAP